MTWTTNHEARATRGDGVHLVPSQRTERHQAVDVPVEWAQPSVIDRATDFYMTRRWPAVVLLILGAAFLGAAIVLATWMLR